MRSYEGPPFFILQGPR